MRKGHSFMTRLFASLLSLSVAFSLGTPASVFAEEANSEETAVVSDQENADSMVVDENSADETTEEETAEVDSAEEETAEVDSTEEETTVEDESEEVLEDSDDASYNDEAEEGTTATKEETEATEEAMTSTTVGGVSYFYADTYGDAEDTVYVMSITKGRGPSATTETHTYSKTELTQAADTDIYYIVAYGSTELTGTLYGYGEGTETSYKDVYEGLGLTDMEDPAYDAVSSATTYTSYHAKDISSTVIYGTDGDGNKAITGLKLNRTPESVGAGGYVEASILKAAGAELTEEQEAVLAITLKKNPTVAPSEDTIEVSGTATYTTSSSYGTGEFDIVPDDTAEGYVWSEYWDNMYAATISDGTTTVGAVHWIDMYGEDSTSGYHYNKVQLALNNGTSVGQNAAAVSRYAAFYDTNTNNVKPGTYTITLYSDGYSPLQTEVTIPAETMTSTSIGGVTYYYADTTDDADGTMYQVNISQGRGPSATTTTYNYAKSDLTQLGDTNYYYIVAKGSTALTGTLYGYGEGTETSYKDVYEELGVTSTDDPAYDAVSSATTYTSFHAKDISSIVVYGTDGDDNKAITGLNLNRASETVDADTYVAASILKAAGEELTEEQEAALAITLKKNPTVAPSEDKIKVSGSATFTTSSTYGTGEFDIVPDDTLDGYVWSEYWDNMYAATVSDGITTVGAVHWIDMYGEDSTSGYHYNKVQLALNNGTSVGQNAAAVSRYAAFYDANTGNIKPGTYTITLYSEGYEPLQTEVTIPAETMTSTSIGGVTYYYADTTGDADGTMYQVNISQGRGPSATTTTYNYKKSELTQLGDTDYYYIVANGSTALTGTLYGYGEGTETSYNEVYKALNVTSTDDPAYDAVSSATTYTSFHAKDISSIVVYGTDGDGNKVITGLNLDREIKTVDADVYVAASILKAAGAELTEEQEAALAITLKKNPMNKPSENTIAVSGTGTFAASTYGTGEFDIVPDDTVEGYVWSEYWDNMYAATISDGTTTVGAVHWIDMYGEDSTSGYHYNKVQLALNNGTSVGQNAAAVSRYAAFYDEDGNIKPGTYTVTLYSEGYEPLTTEIKVDYVTELNAAYETASALKEADYTAASWATFKAELANTTEVLAKDAISKSEAEAQLTNLTNAMNALVKKTVATIKISAKTATYNGKAVSVAKAVTNSNGKVTYTYYSDSACKKALKSAPVSAGTYYAKASVAATDTYTAAVSSAVKVTIKKAAQPMTVKAAKSKVKRSTKKAQKIKLTVSKAQGKVTYTSNKKKYVTVSSKGVITVKKKAKAGKYTITVKAAGNGNYNAGTKKVTITVKK